MVWDRVVLDGWSDIGGEEGTGIMCGFCTCGLEGPDWLHFGVWSDGVYLGFCEWLFYLYLFCLSLLLEHMGSADGCRLRHQVMSVR